MICVRLMMKCLGESAALYPDHARTACSMVPESRAMPPEMCPCRRGPGL